MPNLSTVVFLLLAASMVISTSVKIDKGWLTLDVVTGSQQQEYKVEYNGHLKEALTLTQSSKINIKAKMTFSSEGFQPQFFSFRLRHAVHDNLTEPVLAQWNDEHSVFAAEIDLGDPKQIQHMSGDYKLQIIISDDRFATQVRKFIANCKVTFRHSLEQPIANELLYTTPSIIMTEAPAQRIDPPAIFTGFVCVVLVVLFGLFLMGLNHQKVNFNLFPSSGLGSIFNIVFLGCLGLVLFMLMKFFIDWTFIETLKYFILALLPISFAANYAFIHIKKN